MSPGARLSVTAMLFVALTGCGSPRSRQEGVAMSTAVDHLAIRDLIDRFSTMRLTGKTIAVNLRAAFVATT